MALTKVLILCIFFLHIEALQSVRRYGQENDIEKHRYGNNINDLKFKILNDRSSFGKDNKQDFNLPPYLKKRNRRFKSIYESMHENDFERKSKRRNGDAVKPQYGHLEYQQFLHRNEIPDVDLLNRLLRQSLNSVDVSDHHHHSHQHKSHHHYPRSHQRIKKLRSRPEAGIMQKKLKIN